MSATAAISLPEAWSAVDESVSAFRAEFAGFEHDVSHTLDELERMREQLEARSRQLDQQQRRLELRQQELSEQTVEASRLALQLEHQEAQLADAKQELAEARAELKRMQSAPSASASSAAGDEGIAELKSELDQATLELNLIREHAAELQEIVAEQKREINVQRSDMGDELKELRRIVEHQADILADRPVERAAAPADTAAPASDGGGAAADPVVSSVMAQFAKLQQDVAHRRKAKGKSKS